MTRRKPDPDHAPTLGFPCETCGAFFLVTPDRDAPEHVARIIACPMCTGTGERIAVVRTVSTGALRTLVVDADGTSTVACEGEPTRALLDYCRGLS
jgi:hypothetical protein